MVWYGALRGWMNIVEIHVMNLLHSTILIKQANVFSSHAGSGKHLQAHPDSIYLHLKIQHVPVTGVSRHGIFE